MREAALKDHAASARAKLLAYAKLHGDDYQRVLTRYAIERLLYRLSQTDAAEHYVLKGAMLFVTWPEHASRPTADLDLLGQGDPDPPALTELFTRICQVNVPEDGIKFDPVSLKIQSVREANRYHGAQLSLRAELAKAIIPVQVDIGFGDHVYPPPKRQAFPCLLPHLPPARVLMYPPETVVAEKLEAMISLGTSNGRVKDFYDIWLTARTFPFELSVLVEAIVGTLRRRETDIPTEIPVGLTDAYANIAEARGLWQGFLRRNPPALIPPPFTDVQRELRAFLSPVVAILAHPAFESRHWDPHSLEWR